MSDMARQPTYTVKKLISISPEMAKAIEDFRFSARVASEAEAIRRLLESGLAAERAGNAKAGAA